jgi:hypothetical protein
MLIILPRSADNRGSPDAAARSTGNPQSPPGNPQERILLRRNARSRSLLSLCAGC